MRAKGHRRARDRLRGRPAAGARGRDGRLRGDARRSRPRARATSSSPSPATCTCSAAQHFGVMKNGAIVANSGHFNVEIDIPALRGDVDRASARRGRSSRSTSSATGGTIFLLGEGRLINLAAAEGHPAAVMDMSFANQALVGRAHRQERRRAGDEGLRRAGGDRQGDRAAEARDDGRRDRHAHAPSRRST